MSPLLKKPSLGLAVALVFVATAAVGSATLDHSLIGSWDLIGFSDGGVDAVTTGSAIFGEDGTFTIAGTITFPGEPTDNVSVTGTYEQTGDSVVLIIGQSPSTWALLFSDSDVVLTEVEPPPANTLTLRRQTTPATPLSWGRLKSFFR